MDMIVLVKVEYAVIIMFHFSIYQRHNNTWMVPNSGQLLHDTS